LSRLSEIDDITVEDDNENTLLMLSVRYQMLTLFAQILNSRPKEMSMADMVNVQKKSGHTALLYAVSNTKDEHSSVIKGLLKRGADPNLRVVSNGYSVLVSFSKMQ
jgi:ankyrin repeat protein